MTDIKIDQIRQEYLPHRFPFLMVDRVLEIQVDKSIKAIKNVTINEPIFTGHFPDLAVMPGVLIIEAMAQAGGILIFETLKLSPALETIYFLAGVDNARFKQVVTPGDQLCLYVEVLRRRGDDFWKFKGTASVGDKVVCTAEFINAKGS